MKRSYVTYCQAKSHTSPFSIIDNLPPWVRAGLIDSVALQGGIWVEKEKADVRAYLDRYLQIGISADYTRYEHLEISREHFDDYDYFTIMPSTLSLFSDLDFKYVEPTCPAKKCQTSARILSDVTILKRNMDRYDLASIYWLWENDVELLISQRLKAEFEEKEISGLRYEPCSPESKTSGYFRATITTAIPHFADDIVVLNGCETCGTILNFALFGQRTEKCSVQPLDFQSIDKVIANGKPYYYRKRYWMISRRVLKILLSRKVKGLAPCGYLLKEAFLPVELN